MKHHKKIYFIDFDQTLFNTSNKIEGEKEYKRITGKEFPKDKEFWNSDLSFDDTVFPIKPYTKVENIIKKANQDKDSYVIILTSRLEPVREGMLKLLKKHNIKIDELSMRTSKDFTKTNRILKHIKEFPDVEEVYIYDDNMSLIDEDKLKKELKDIKINVYEANTGKLELQEAIILNIIDNTIFNYLSTLNEDYRNEIRKIWEKPIRNLINIIINHLNKIGIKTDNGKISVTDYGISGYIKIAFPDNQIREIRISDHSAGYNRSNSGKEYLIYSPFENKSVNDVLNKLKQDYKQLTNKNINTPQYATT